MAPQPLIGLLEVDADLGDGIEPEELDQARRLIVGIRELVMPGEWNPSASIADSDSPAFAALVVDGLLTRDRALATSLNSELFGPGDLIEPWTDGAGLVPSDVRWQAFAPTTIALLDRRFVIAMRRWPTLALRLFERGWEQAERASVHAAINGIRGVEQRIMAMLWHLAGLYGKVRPQGVVLPMRLSHSALGRLVAARRPTVSLAMKTLVDQGFVAIDDPGGFVLREESRAALAPPAQALSHGAVGITSLEPLGPS